MFCNSNTNKTQNRIQENETHPILILKVFKTFRNTRYFETFTRGANPKKL